MQKVRWISRCRACGNERKGICEQGMEPHRYCCGWEVRTKTILQIKPEKEKCMRG